MTTLDCPKGYSNPHVPTALTRELVKNLYALGISIEKIANRLNIDADTLSKHYREELDEALQNMNVVAMNKLYAKVEEGHYKAIVSWLKMRAGWREAGADGEEDKVAQYLLDQLHKKDKDNAEL
jgi:transposase